MAKDSKVKKLNYGRNFDDRLMLTTTRMRMMVAVTMCRMMMMVGNNRMLWRCLGMLLVALSLSGFWGFGKSNIEFPKS